ncbi:hypothetical protein [Sediminicola sp. 1XM1-17]|uniref:hypothetical protein n=1 Tax=Sediminicola sp. 1XM1-17 TaxID=3127702 RepID=UPI003077753B
MKLFSFAVSILFILSSCNKDSDKSLYQEYEGSWVLVKMSGNTPNSETTGPAMQWQETYLFKSNGTFLKSRKQGGSVTDSKGTFTVIKSEEGTRLELTHHTDSEIIGSCLGNQKEVLYLESKEVLTSTWNHCDGPGLVYERTMKMI